VFIFLERGHRPRTDEGIPGIAGVLAGSFSRAWPAGTPAIPGKICSARPDLPMVRRLVDERNPIVVKSYAKV